MSRRGRGVFTTVPEGKIGHAYALPPADKANFIVHYSVRPYKTVTPETRSDRSKTTTWSCGFFIVKEARDFPAASTLAEETSPKKKTIEDCKDGDKMKTEGSVGAKPV